MILEARNLTKTFKGVLAVDGVTLGVEPGEISCIIGPNGAGKSTLLKLFAGFLRPSSGNVLFDGQDITHMLPYARAQRGIVTKFQVTNLYENLTVWENVRIPAQRVLGKGRVPDRERAVERRVSEILAEIGLVERHELRASHLSHGERQWLEIGMVLGMEPQVMLLDEPTAGMTPSETRATAQMLKRLVAAAQTTVIIVEHDMHFVREIAQRVRVMHLGRILTEGSLAQVEANNQVRKVYLGQA